MKGIILAGGSGTRLYPLTLGASKQILPIYDKPMVYYPLSVLLLAGIRDILIISTPEDINSFKRLFGNGSNIGINLSYKVQDKPKGIADAFIIGESFIGKDNVCLILGDNIFYGNNLRKNLISNLDNVKENNAVIFAYNVKNPSEYGVVEFDSKNKIIEIEEKPIKPKSNYAVTGLYFYPNDVINYAKKIEKSDRGELEITSINNIYIKRNKIKLSLLGRGYVWLDTGTHESMIEASNYIYSLEKRSGLKIACIEEISYNLNYINKSQLYSLSEKYKNSDYGKYLKKIIS